VAITGNCCNCC